MFSNSLELIPSVGQLQVLSDKIIILRYASDLTSRIKCMII